MVHPHGGDVTRASEGERAEAHHEQETSRSGRVEMPAWRRQVKDSSLKKEVTCPQFFTLPLIPTKVPVLGIDPGPLARGAVSTRDPISQTLRPPPGPKSCRWDLPGGVTEMWGSVRDPQGPPGASGLRTRLPSPQGERERAGQGLRAPRPKFGSVPTPLVTL